MNRWIRWGEGLLIAAIGAAATVLLSVYTSPAEVDFSPAGIKKMILVGGGGALLAVLSYLKQSPLPPPDK